ncbi:hypothetical protein B0I33_107104 [Prauserella shujinwangii]|uniref:Alpha/beta hydrolase family protein n=1 Tax=Prauserella shujinwangii TaxID=1453103 RepID=A0A2T0LS80_9PSEU|nr:hypothetical protein [Prauserella shujinwangii]PRX46527.1 hypothetical protein B0I33_107104 [Prauserella shujinwangii]
MVAPGPTGYDSDPRAGGPALLWSGTTGSPVLFVLDPADELKPADVPPAWADLVADRQVAWCRVRADGALTEADELLADPDGLGSPIDLVTSGRAGLETLDLACRHTDTVRSVLFVDPEETEAGPGSGTAIPDNRRREQESLRTRELESAGVAVRVIARDHIGRPTPLSHPDVAAAVRRAVTELDRGGA